MTLLNGKIEALNKCSGIDVAGTLNISDRIEISSVNNPSLHMSTNGILNLSGGKITSANKAISTLGGNGSVINISGTPELISTATDMSAVEIKDNSSFTITGGSITSQNNTGLVIGATAKSVTIGSASNYGLTNGLLIQGLKFGIDSSTQFIFNGGIVKGGQQAIKNEVNAIKPNAYTITQETENISNTNYYVSYLSLNEQYVAAIANEYYNTLQGAINAVPTNNTQTVIKLLRSVNEAVVVGQNQNIKFNLQNYQISNSSSSVTIVNNGTITIYNGSIVTTKTVGIENNGSLKISGGLIDTTASQGAINNNSGATLEITGGRVTARGKTCKQAIYNNGGTAIISDNAYLSSESNNGNNTRATLHNLNGGTLIVKGGTIISKEYIGLKIDGGIVTVGDNADSSLRTVPVIQGTTYGITSSVGFNYYDGILKGITAGVDNISKIIFDSNLYELKNDVELIDDTTYKTISLKNK